MQSILLKSELEISKIFGNVCLHWHMAKVCHALSCSHLPIIANGNISSCSVLFTFPIMAYFASWIIPPRSVCKIVCGCLYLIHSWGSTKESRPSARLKMKLCTCSLAPVLWPKGAADTFPIILVPPVSLVIPSGDVWIPVIKGYPALLV